MEARSWTIIWYRFVYCCFTSQDSKTSNSVEKDDDHLPDSPTTASELDDGRQSSTKNLESTPETLRSENVLVGKASKTELMPDSRFLQKKLKVNNFVPCRCLYLKQTNYLKQKIMAVRHHHLISKQWSRELRSNTYLAQQYSWSAGKLYFQVVLGGKKIYLRHLHLHQKILFCENGR